MVPEEGSHSQIKLLNKNNKILQMGISTPKMTPPDSMKINTFGARGGTVPLGVFAVDEHSPLAIPSPLDPCGFPGATIPMDGHKISEPARSAASP